MSEASIVYRTKDMFSTGKIYIDDMEKAATWASTYRNASYFVDVINRQDEVAYRWENGAPDWKLGEVVPSSLNVEPYQFERCNDLLWEPQNRLWTLIEALNFAFDTAVGVADVSDFEGMAQRAEQSGHDDVWDLIAEANDVAKIVKEQNTAASLMNVIDGWMSDGDRLFASYAVEQTALELYVFQQDPLATPGDLSHQIHKLRIKLGRLHT